MTLKRELFPVCEQYSYFLTAGMGPLSEVACDAVVEQYRKTCTQGGGVFRENMEMVEVCRTRVAELINTMPENIAFTPNVSFSMNVLALSIKMKKNISRTISLKEEFPASTIPWKENGYDLKLYDNYDQIQKLPSEQLNNSVLVVSIVQYSTGHTVDVSSFVNSIRSSAPECFIVLNATQSVGVIPIDMEKVEADAVTCTCHKWLMSGEGISFLWISERGFSQLEPKFVGWKSMIDFMRMKLDGYVLKNDARVFEIGWLNHTGFFAFNESLKMINELGVENINKSITKTRAYLVERLKDAKISVVSDLKKSDGTGIILLGPFQNSQNIVERLRTYKILASARGNGVRIALHFFNNTSDADNLVDRMTAILIE